MHITTPPRYGASHRAPPNSADKTLRAYAYSASPSEIGQGNLSYVNKDKEAVILVLFIMVWVWEVVVIWRHWHCGQWYSMFKDNLFCHLHQHFWIWNRSCKLRECRATILTLPDIQEKSIKNLCPSSEQSVVIRMRGTKTFLRTTNQEERLAYCSIESQCICRAAYMRLRRRWKSPTLKILNSSEWVNITGMNNFSATDLSICCLVIDRKDGKVR